MSANDGLVLAPDAISRNPGIDGDVVREALRMRQALESMGIWVDKGSRVVSPFAVRPSKMPVQQPIMPVLARRESFSGRF